MKKYILIWLLVIAILSTGCAAGKIDESQPAPSTTAGTTESTTEATTEPTTETTTEATEETTSATETTAPEDTEPADNGLSDYLAAIEEQSNQLKAALQNEAMTQAELNSKAQELYQLWDDALNDLWGKLQDQLPDDEFDRLLDEQLQWIDDKEAAVEEAGKAYEGGSIYPLIVNTEAAQITEDRVYELYDLLTQ